MPQSKGYAAQDPKSPLAPFNFSRREPGATEIAIEILFCGVCHSDLHMARNEWGNAIYPMVPGHEIVGRVTALGKNVKKFRLGENAAVGVIVDSCRHCDPCNRGEEHFCREGATLTYAAKDRVDDSITMGGYSNNYVVDERFAHTIPASLDPRCCCTAALRRHHHLLAFAPLGNRARQESWHHRPRRPGPHGSQICSCIWRAHRAVDHVSERKTRRRD